jgi:hypothetical protein
MARSINLKTTRRQPEEGDGVATLHEQVHAVDLAVFGLSLSL